MRVLVVSQYFWPENFRVNDLVAGLVGRGHAVTVLTGVPNYPDGTVFPDFRRAPERYADYHGAAVRRVPLVTRGRGGKRLMLNYASFVLSGCLWGLWRLRGLQFDAVFVFASSPITSSLPALLIGRLKHAPVLLWVLDLWPETLSAVGAVRSGLVLRMVGRLVAFIYRRCALVLGQSRAFAASIARYAGDAASFRYFPGWPEPLFKDPVGQCRPAPEVERYRETFNVMFAGNIGVAQDFPTIVEAADRLRDRTHIRWLIVGDGRAAGWVRQEIDRRGLAETVVMLGRHPIERMPSFFAVAGALLVSLRPDPIFALTIPGKVQSYLASGVPLIGMLDGEGARVISESGAGVVCPAGDAASLARHVADLASLTPRERATIGMRGLDYVRREFNRDHLLSQLETWMREAAGARAG